jgi:hypothetical protein
VILPVVFDDGARTGGVGLVKARQIEARQDGYLRLSSSVVFDDAARLGRIGRGYVRPVRAGQDKVALVD